MENNNNDNHSEMEEIDIGEKQEESSNFGEDLESTHLTEDEDPDMENIKEKVREMEEEAEKLRQMQGESSNNAPASASSTSSLSAEEKMELDARSVYVGNVDYSATGNELEKHFHGCGSIKRVTILADKYNGHPKGFAYIEFSDSDSVETASALNNSLFKGRQIKVMPKRTNRPGISTTNRPPKRGFGRGSARGYIGRPSPYPRGFRGGYRGRGIRGAW